MRIKRDKERIVINASFDNGSTGSSNQKRVVDDSNQAVQALGRVTTER